VRRFSGYVAGKHLAGRRNRANRKDTIRPLRHRSLDIADKTLDPPVARPALMSPHRGSMLVRT
jgi:hypothetical protein